LAVVYFTGGGAERGELSIMKLAIAQMVFGVIILFDFFYGTFADGFFRFIPQRWDIVICLSFPASALGVLGCGIAQYLKARG